MDESRLDTRRIKAGVPNAKMTLSVQQRHLKLPMDRDGSSLMSVVMRRIVADVVGGRQEKYAGDCCHHSHVVTANHC
jgi:hypothetical protein